MFDREKFKRLVHYICWKSENYPSLGAIKLNKVLLYAEREHFVKFGVPITGVVFVKRQFGPAPPAVVSVLNELQDDRAIIIRDRVEYGKPKRDFVNITEPELTGFTLAELSIVDRVMTDVCLRHTARSISNKTHDAVWEMAHMGEEIPLYTVFGVQGEVDEADFAWANSVVDRLEGNVA